MFIHNHSDQLTHTILYLKVPQAQGPDSQSHPQMCFGIGFSSLIFLTVDILFSEILMGASYCWPDKKSPFPLAATNFNFHASTEKYMKQRC